MIPRVARVCALCALLCMACDPAAAPDQGAPDRPACAGATAAQANAPDDPLVWRGVVRAPGASELGLRGSPLDWLIPSAHAMQLLGESAVAGATVTAQRGEERVSAVTDAQGRYCLRVKQAWGHAWSLTAALPSGATLRGLPDLPGQADISAQTEAMQRALAGAGRDPATLTPTQRLNLHTLADTALGLMQPTSLEGLALDAALARAEGALQADARWQAAIKAGE
jgi:hypothetical protein